MNIICLNTEQAEQRRKIIIVRVDYKQSREIRFAPI